VPNSAFGSTWCFSTLRLRRAYVLTSLRPSASYDMLNDSYDVNGRQDKQVILQASDGHIVFPPSICCPFRIPLAMSVILGPVTGASTSDSACSIFISSGASGERVQETDGSVQVRFECVAKPLLCLLKCCS
jgi:hypothetical protein